VALTYACPKNKDDNPIESKEILLEELKKKFKPENMFNGYVIGQEQHENEKKHFHVYLRFEERFQTRNARFFDVLGVHPKVEVAGPRWINYCAKDGDILKENVKLPGEGKELKQLKNAAFDTAVEMAKEGKVQEAMEHLQKYQAKDYLFRAKMWRETLTDIWNKERVTKKPSRIFETRWTDRVEAIDVNFVEEGELCPRTMIFTGNQGIGKTEAAKYLLQKAGFKRVLIANHAEDLKRLHDFDAFIFDECNINAPDGKREPWTHEEQIYLVDWAEDRTLPARYVNITIPSGKCSLRCAWFFRPPSLRPSKTLLMNLSQGRRES